MSVRERVVRGRVASDHTCQFFDSEESRAEAVASFLAEGFRAGDHIIVIARPIHWVSISERLEACGIPVERALLQGKLTVKDAMDTLRRLSRGGVPNQGAFDEIVAAPLRGLAELGRVRAYGEMVDILAQRGELDEVMRLEEMWNRLGESTSFSLMCGYAAAHFVSTATHRSMRDICTTHTDVKRCNQDPLANWLLTTAHNSVAASSTTSH
jgi:hypothetical protein